MHETFFLPCLVGRQHCMTCTPHATFKLSLYAVLSSSSFFLLILGFLFGFPLLPLWIRISSDYSFISFQDGIFGRKEKVRAGSLCMHTCTAILLPHTFFLPSCHRLHCIHTCTAHKTHAAGLHRHTCKCNQDSEMRTGRQAGAGAARKPAFSPLSTLSRDIWNLFLF